MAEAQRKEQERERTAREQADRLFAEKERKVQEREEQAKLAAAERAALKIQRREEYPPLFPHFPSLFPLSLQHAVLSFSIFLLVIPPDKLRYEQNKALDAKRKQQEFVERQAKLLAEFVKRQERRARKQLLKEQPIIPKNYDEQKVSPFPLSYVCAWVCAYVCASVCHWIFNI
jgi:hypothetical protein